MKIIKNEKLIKRNGTIGNWTSLAAVVILGGAMYATLKYPASTQLIIYSGIAFIVGLILTQIGMYMGIRFGRTPRPDEKLDTGLKGLQNEYIMYHYTTPVSHLLVGPAGVWVMMPYHQRGQAMFKKNRWRLSGGGFVQSYMRIFGQEGLGRPDIEIDNEIRSLKKHLSKKMDESEIPEINALMVFTDDTVEIDGEGSPVPAMKLKQVKEFMRQKAKEKKLAAEKLNELKTVLE
jgi:hypothetical protein